MSNFFVYNEERVGIGDTITVHYRFVESDGKERIQPFQGIVIKIKGDSEDVRNFTVRKISKSNIGIERVIPVASPYVAKITVDKKSSYDRARAYFIRELSQAKLKKKLYRSR